MTFFPTMSCTSPSLLIRAINTPSELAVLLQFATRPYEHESILIATIVSIVIYLRRR